jgi:hypothetical protein
MHTALFSNPPVKRQDNHESIYRKTVFRIWTQIRSGLYQVSNSGFGIRIRMGEKMTRKIEKGKKFHVLSFSCSLDVLYGGLGIIKLIFLIKKYQI